MVCSSSCATRTSCVRSPPGSGVSDTRIVSPIPCCSRMPIAADEATMPLRAHAGLGQPQMQRIVAARRELLIDRDQVLHVRHFGREDDPVARRARSPRPAAR